MRAMDTAETGYGLQLIGAQYVGQLWEAARTDMRVANLIGSFEMTAPVAYVPVEVDFPQCSMWASPLARPSPTTPRARPDRTWSRSRPRSSSFTRCGPVKWKRTASSRISPSYAGRRRSPSPYYMDSLALNGDTTGTNGLNGADSVLAATVHTLAFDGLRHAALVDNTANCSSAANAPIELSFFRGAYSRMIDATYLHDWGHPNDPNDLVHIVDPYTADAMLGLDEFATRDKAGNDATLFAGQVARVTTTP